MNDQSTLNLLMEQGIIAIIRGVSSGAIIQTAQALLDGGVHCMEITFDPSSSERSADTLRSISLVKKRFQNQVLVGAGTVLTPEDAEAAVVAGAKYIISPNVNPDVIKKTKELGAVSMPGAFTPTEMELAHSYGCDIVKVFPAGILGVSYLKAVCASLSHLKVAAVGGIDETNIGEFVKGGIRCFGIGGNLVKSKLILENRFDQITSNARHLVTALKEASVI